MFALKLLGGVALADETGPLTGRAVQKRRLALVARLVLAPHRTLSRDKIIALLWPESDSEQARHLLSVSLHELRRTLGVDVIQSRADDLTLSPQLITSDVESFEAALQRGDAETAVTLYEGPFMDGFFATDAPELEEWIQGERNRLSREYATALDQAARARIARGDHVAGVEAWRRLAALEPFNARVARELMLALDTAGDRAGALQHARAHTTLLKEEFGAEPDPEIAALAEQLRSAPVPPVRPSVAVTVPPTPNAAVVTTIMPQSQAIRAFAGKSPRRRARRRTRWMVSIAALISLIAAPFIWLEVRRNAAAANDHTSIAVLPFRSTTPSDSLQLFGEGVADEIISTLSRVEQLSVVARTSSFSMEDSLDIRDVAEKLNVGAVLEGTVQRSGGRLKVNTSLVDAKTGYSIWNDKFEAEWNIDDLLGMYEEIAQALARALTVELIEPKVATAGLRQGSPRSIAAYDAYVSGRSHFDSRTPEDLQSAFADYRRASRADPQYALAYAGQAEVLVVIGAYDYGGMPPDSAFTAAKQAVDAALKIDPDLPEAYAALGNIRFNYDWDWDGAEKAFRRALELNPGEAQTHHWYSLLLAARNRMPEAYKAIDRAVKLDPVSAVMITSLARHFYFARDYKRALAEFRRSLEIAPDYPLAHAGIGTVFVQLQQYDSALAHYDRAARILGTRTPVLRGLTAQAAGLAGDTARARAELAALKAAAGTSYISPDYLALAYMGLRDYPHAIESLERSYQARSGSMAYLKVEPALDPLRNDPAFKRLVAKVGL